MNTSLINLRDFFVVGLMAVVFIALVNFIFRRVGIPFQA